MSSGHYSSAEQPASLEEEARTTIEEAKMVLPGIQALFEFQLVAPLERETPSLTGGIQKEKVKNRELSFSDQ
jgi:hypothetical protein